MLNEQEQVLKESAAVFTRLIGNEKGGEAAARGRLPMASTPAATGKHIASREFVERTIERVLNEHLEPIRQAIEPLKLRESEDVSAETG